MAIRYLITGGPHTYTGPGANIWHANPDSAVSDGGFVEAADVAAFTVNSGNLILAVNMACTGWDSTGYAGTFALGANDLDVNGSFIFEGTITGTGDVYSSTSISFVAGSTTAGWSGTLISDTIGVATLTTNAVVIPNLEINNAPTSFTLQDNMTVGAMTFTAGKFTTTGREVRLRVGTHNIDWATATYQLNHLIIPDNAKAELTGHLRIHEITIGNGVGSVSVSSTTARYIMVYCNANDPWHQTASSGMLECGIIRFYMLGNYQIGYLDASDITIELQIRSSGGSRTVTMTDDWMTGALAIVIEGGAVPDIQTLDTNSYDLIAGALTLGTTGATNQSGVLICGTGSHTIASLAAGNVANLNNIFDFSDAGGEVTLSGTFDGTSISCLGPAGGQSIFYDGGGVPVIQDAVFDNVVYAEEGIDISDAENVNVLRLGGGNLLLLLGIGS